MQSKRKSRFVLHVERWGKRGVGCGSTHCQTANKVCLARGSIPCDVLLVGEAPAESEDSLGVPFIGPAGHLLDRIVSEGLPMHLRKAFTNIVGCIPRDETGAKFTEPDPLQIKACQPRLIEFVSICQPQLIVLVGKLAQKWFPRQKVNAVDEKVGWEPPKYAEITHPAAILRNNIAAQEWMTDTAIATLRTACESLSEVPY